GSGHISKLYPDKHRSPKCISYENFDRKSNVCPQNPVPGSSNVNNVYKVTPLTTTCKGVQIFTKILLSLIDTVSQVPLMKENV
ncbi:hypothetical protein NPIL_603811, partial [Nephila pilipes]